MSELTYNVTEDGHSRHPRRGKYCELAKFEPTFVLNKTMLFVILIVRKYFLIGVYNQTCSLMKLLKHKSDHYVSYTKAIQNFSKLEKYRDG